MSPTASLADQAEPVGGEEAEFGIDGASFEIELPGRFGLRGGRAGLWGGVPADP